jgi:hypothetical protein
MRWSAFRTMATLLALFRCFFYVFFSAVSVALNRSIVSSNGAAVNGLSILGGCIMKSAGSALVGILMAASGVKRNRLHVRKATMRT